LGSICATNLRSTATIPVLDYRNAFSQAPEFFTDPDHLNNAGSAEFSRRIADDLRERLQLPPADRWNCDAEPLTTTGRLMPFGWVRTAAGLD
jgi:hypothetical protein